MIHQLLNRQRKELPSDADIVAGLQAHDRSVEEQFYRSAKQYFMTHFKDIFFDEDRKQEIFQDSVLRLWTEIEDGRIRAAGAHLERLQASGAWLPMTANLTTFLMAIARNSYREVVRSNKEQTYGNIFDITPAGGAPMQDVDDADEADDIRIIDECIQEMPPRCLEILTLFYYEGRSLDEIMTLRCGKNESKTGLKTAKYKCMQTLKQRVMERRGQL